MRNAIFIIIDEQSQRERQLLKLVVEKDDVQLY